MGVQISVVSHVEVSFSLVTFYTLSIINYHFFEESQQSKIKNFQIHQIEFCICFKANETEYWDSNSGTNYVLHCAQHHPVVPQQQQQRRASLFGGLVTKSF